jgi:hypothetical protein
LNAYVPLGASLPAQLSNSLPAFAAAFERNPYVSDKDVRVRDSILDALSNRSYIYFGDMGHITAVIETEVTNEDMCTKYELVHITGMAPLWYAVIMSPHSRWFNTVNFNVAHRMTYFQLDETDGRTPDEWGFIFGVI